MTTDQQEELRAIRDDIKRYTNVIESMLSDVNKLADRLADLVFDDRDRQSKECARRPVPLIALNCGP